MLGRLGNYVRGLFGSRKKEETMQEVHSEAEEVHEVDIVAEAQAKLEAFRSNPEPTDREFFETIELLRDARYKFKEPWKEAFEEFLLEKTGGDEDEERRLLYGGGFKEMYGVQFFTCSPMDGITCSIQPLLDLRESHEDDEALQKLLDYDYLITFNELDTAMREISERFSERSGIDQCTGKSMSTYGHSTFEDFDASRRELPEEVAEIRDDLLAMYIDDYNFSLNAFLRLYDVDDLMERGIPEEICMSILDLQGIGRELEERKKKECEEAQARGELWNTFEVWRMQGGWQELIYSKAGGKEYAPGEFDLNELSRDQKHALRESIIERLLPIVEVSDGIHPALKSNVRYAAMSAATGNGYKGCPGTMGSASEVVRNILDAAKEKGLEIKYTPSE